VIKQEIAKELKSLTDLTVGRPQRGPLTVYYLINRSECVAFQMIFYWNRWNRVPLNKPEWDCWFW